MLDSNRPRTRSGMASVLSVSRIALGTTVLTMGLHAAPQSTPTHTAVSAGAPTPFPSPGTYSFEGMPSLVIPPTTPPSSEFGPWTFWDTAKLIHKSDPEMGALAPAHGDHVALINGDGRVEADAQLTAGFWRFRYQAAQQSVGTQVDEQELRLTLAPPVGDVLLLATDRPNEDFREFRTRVVHVPVAGTYTLAFDGLGGATDTAFIDEVQLEPVADWHDATSWVSQPGSAPYVRDRVLVPDGVAVAIHGGCFADEIVVEGELIASNADTTMYASAIEVDGQNDEQDPARFQVGTEGAPFLEEFVLTLSGSRGDAPSFAAGMSNKGLVGRRGGILQLHGEPRVSWTRLDQTASAGDTLLQLDPATPVDWEDDDLLVIAGSIRPPTGGPNVAYIDYAETATIAPAGVTGNAVSLTGMLANYHHGGPIQQYSRHGESGVHWELDQRAEVGLLSRNVRVQGDSSSDEGGVGGFGGHVMVMGPGGANDSPGQGYFSNVELTRMGQAGVLGRYPIHWHECENQAEGQYVRNCAIHHTYQRAVVVHGTDSIRVEDNVAYKNKAHAIFLENGEERFNVISGNLVISTERPDEGDEENNFTLLFSDREFQEFQNRSPASFWISNPQNYINDNVAAGTEGTGFWFAFPDNELDADYYDAMTPSELPLGSFRGNVCHSSRTGVDVNDSFRPFSGGPPFDDLETNRSWNPPTTAFIDDFTMYSCHQGLYAGTGDGDIVYRNNVIADCRRSVVLAAYHTVDDTLILADSGNGLEDVLNNQLTAAYVLYDGAGTVTESSIQGYDFNEVGRTLLGAQGGNRKHCNTLFENVDFGQGNPKPRIDFLDYDSETPGCNSGVVVDADPRRWGMTVRVEGGGFADWDGSTIISNHRMLARTTTNSGPLWNTAYPGDEAWDPSTNVAFVSPYRFGHLMCLYRNASGGVVPLHPQNNSHPLKVYRLNNQNWLAGSYENCYTIDAHHQLPLVVNHLVDDSDDFVYSFEWETGMHASVSFCDIHIGDVHVADTDPEDHNLIKLPGFRTTGDPSVEMLNDDGTPQSVHQYPSVQRLRLGTTTGYAYAGNDLWLLFYYPADGSEITLRVDTIYR